MALPREEIIDGLQAEQAGFEDLIRSVRPDQWTTPTRCEGWTIRDIAAHVTGTLADIVNGNTHLLGQPGATDRQADERKDRSPDEVSDELHGAVKVVADLAPTFDDAAWNGPPPVDVPGTLGEAVEGLWYDTYVHAEDIRVALGRPSERGPGLRASVSHLADLLGHQSWGPATLALDGLEEFPVNGGGDRRVTGDPLAFVLTATGRGDPAELGLDETVNIYRDA